MLSVAAVKRFKTVIVDVSNAYLHASLQQPVFIRIPPFLPQGGKVVKLRKALYGLKQSGSAWHDELKGTLFHFGFTQSIVDACLFVNNNVYIGVYVDDLLITGKEEAVTPIISKLSGKFPIKVKGLDSMTDFLGIDLEDCEQGFKMTMETYINKMSKPFPNVNERRCPIGTERLSEKSDPQNPFPASEYAHIVGQLLWVSLTVRYDIAFSVKELSKFLQQPSLAHYRAAMRVVGYLKKTSKLGILFPREPTFPEQPTGVDISKFQGNRYGYSIIDSPIEHGKLQDNSIH
ncbi:MAG: reverse transcriptase domain-containing protein, partial [Bacteroidota bacterium]